MNDDDRVDLTPWTAPPPPTDLADRVADAIAAPTASTAQEPPTVRRRWWLAVAAASGAVALAAGVAIVAWPRATSSRSHGALVATAATTIELADGVEAMAEPGAELSWRTDARGVQVTHRAGIVTYRQRGTRALDVDVTAAVLTSTRTTYRVEVPMNRSLIVGGGAAAAAVAVIAIVTVYDGEVAAEQPAQAPRTIAAGERVELTVPSTPPAPRPTPVTVAARDRVRRDAIAAAMLARRPSAARPPTTDPGSAMVGSAPPAPLTLDKEEIRTGVKDVVPMLSECYEAELERDPAIGEITVKTHFELDSDAELGTIVTLRDLEVSGPLAQASDFRDCMTATIEAVVLPPLGDGGHVDVNYPFVFRPNDEGDDGGDGEHGGHGGEATKPATPTPTKPTPVRPPKPVVTPNAAKLADEAAQAAINGQYARALWLSEQGLTMNPTTAVRTKLINIAALCACNLKNVGKVRRFYPLASPNARIGIRQTCMRVAQFDPEAP